MEAQVSGRGLRRGRNEADRVGPSVRDARRGGTPSDCTGSTHTHKSTSGEYRLGPELQSQASARKRVAALVTGGAGSNEQRECGGEVRGARLARTGCSERGARTRPRTRKRVMEERIQRAFRGAHRSKQGGPMGPVEAWTPTRASEHGAPRQERTCEHSAMREERANDR